MSLIKMLCSECWYNVPRNVPQFVLGVVTVMGGVRPGEAILTLLTQPFSLSLQLRLPGLPQSAHYHGLEVHQACGEGNGLTHLFLGRTEVSSEIFKITSFYPKI